MFKAFIIILSWWTSVVAGNQLWKETGNAYEGLRKIEPESFNECLYQCIIYEDCKVVSYDELTNKCFIQLDKEVKIVNKDPESATKFYTLDANQLYKGNMCWNKIPGKKLQGLTNLYLYRTKYLCIIYCLGTKMCHSFTFDTSTEYPCWIQIAADALNITENSFEPSPDATSYILDKDCLLKPKLLSEE